MENIKILIHRLNNLAGFSESCMNRLKNSDVKSVSKRWTTMKDVFIATGRDRLEREIESYRKINDISYGETHNDIIMRLSEVNRHYKAIFDLFDGSGDFSDNNKNTALKNGINMVSLLKNTIKKLEEMKLGSQ